MKYLIIILVMLSSCAKGRPPYEPLPHGTACSSEAPLFQFAQASDTHIGRIRGTPSANLIETVDMANSYNVAFTLFTGDISDNAARDLTEGAEELDEFLAITSKLNAPAYYAPGNHDVTSADRVANNAMFEAKLGALNSTFDYMGYRFILIDDNPVDTSSDQSRLSLTDAQFEWVKSLLDEGKPTFVVGHINVFDWGEFNGPKARDLANLLSSYSNVIGYLHGHRHTGRLNFYKNKIFFGVPATIGFIAGDHSPGLGGGHIAIHKVFADKIETCLVPIDGSTPDRMFMRNLQ